MELTAIVRVLELAGLSGVRPTWVLTAAAAAGALGYVQMPPGLEFMASWPAAAGMLAFAVIEHHAERDLDLQSAFAAVQLGLGAASALLASGVVARLGTNAPPPWALSVAAVLIAVLTIGVRRQLKAQLLQVSATLSTPARWLARAEEGGVLVLAALVFFAPFVVLGVMLLAALGSGALFFLVRLLERRYRLPCGSCGRSIRVEASVCPHCRAALTPVRTLEAPARLTERLGALQAPQPTR